MMLLSRGAATAATAATAGAVVRVCQLQRTCRNKSFTQSSSSQLHCSTFAPSRTRSRGWGPAALPSRGFVVACAAESSTVELDIKVEGMKCGGCSSKVEATLKAMDHVKGVQVDLETKLATVEVEAPNLIDAMNMLPLFVKAIKEIGFEAEPHIEYQA